MTPDAIRRLLEQVAAGEVDVQGALGALKDLPFEDLGFAKVDHHRALRLGAPEVVFGQGKAPDDLGRISRAIVDRGQALLVTRVDEAQARAVLAAVPHARHEVRARCVVAPAAGAAGSPAEGLVLVVAAGTSDLPVAEEARVTAEALGCRVESLYDVGVAGIHRLLAHTDRLRAASVVVVVAGMEGALPSVVGGLVDRPVIAVPTSIGYGAALGGLTALLGMLTSCAPGVTVVNIDNGFGAGYAAARIARLAAARA